MDLSFTSPEQRAVITDRIDLPIIDFCSQSFYNVLVRFIHELDTRIEIIESFIQLFSRVHAFSNWINLLS